jgi:ABC-2 type transport system ATP-binding protein
MRRVARVIYETKIKRSLVPMLQINHYTKQYSANGPKAVDDLSLHIRPGEIYGFLGHNGAGKTTTIKACCGILDFTEGDIFMDGHSVKTEPIECKKITAYIPDNPDLYENLTGIQYLNFIADVFRISEAEREAAIKKYSDLFELTDSLGDLISSYSHGMKQKLAIISALIHSPKLMVMDEPFVGLDPKAAFTLKQIMHEMCANGTAIFFSTHVLDVAEKLCNKVAIIKNGKIIDTGTMEELTGKKSLEEVFLEVQDEQK